MSRPARPMFYMPPARTVPYKQPLMARIETQSHFVGGLLLVTGASPGALAQQLTRAMAEVDPNLTLATVRTLREQIAACASWQR